MVYRIWEKKSYMDRDWLYRMYINENLCPREIGEICDVSHTTIHRWLKKLEIPIRDLSEAMKLSDWRDGEALAKKREKMKKAEVEIALKDLEDAL